MKKLVTLLFLITSVIGNAQENIDTLSDFDFYCYIKFETATMPSDSLKEIINKRIEKLSAKLDSCETVLKDTKVNRKNKKDYKNTQIEALNYELYISYFNFKILARESYEICRDNGGIKCLDKQGMAMLWHIKYTNTKEEIDKLIK